MKINNQKAIHDFKSAHPETAGSINSWQAETSRAQWATPNQLKEQFGNASILKSGHVIFNICGNKYRLWVQISYKLGVVFVKKIGTHKEYDEWEIR